MKFLASRSRQIALSLFALQSNSEQPTARAGATIRTNLSTDNDFDCRSNSTHIVWKTTRITAPLPSFGRKTQSTVQKTFQCTWQLRKDAEQECMEYLQDNLMAFDEPFQETMGFPTKDTDPTDGLNNGLVGPTIQLALDAKILYKWTDDLPKYLFFNYVLNYANLNEAQTNWRPLLVNAMKFNTTDLYQSGNANVTSVVTWVNTNLWTLLGRPGSPIFFKSGQTPLIFDPMSTIAFGYASCTGTSILFCNALRAVGIPARVAGTPAWYGDIANGNHNWVEVYDPSVGHWKFLEPSPALDNVDNLDKNPCSRWFCQSSRYPSSKVYAAKLSKRGCPHDDEEDPSYYFPLAWEWGCEDVPAVDRTQYYSDICGLCPHNEEEKQ